MSPSTSSVSPAPPPASCPRCATPLDQSGQCPRCGSTAGERPEPDPWVGRLLDGRYRVLDCIGRGGTGAVYRVLHAGLGKIAAIKILHPALLADREAIARFQCEARAIGKLTDEHAVQLFDFSQSAEAVYLVMELVEGGDLGGRLLRGGPLSFEQAAPIFEQVCQALGDAHGLGIIHRDLKPENILLTGGPGGAPLVKVVDFGLALIREPEEADGGAALTSPGRLIGTPYYMSPEQIRCQALDGRSDLYSLGAVLYKALTGVPPFRASTPYGVLAKHLTEEPSPPSRLLVTVPPAVDELVLRAMAKPIEQRYRDAAEMRQALAGLRQTAWAAGPPASTAARMAIAGEARRDRQPDEQRRAPAAPVLGEQPDLDAASASTSTWRGVDGEQDYRGPIASVGPTARVDRLSRREWEGFERSLRRRRRLRLAGLALAPLLAAAVGWLMVLRVRSAPLPTKEREPNDTTANANPFPIGQTLTGSIGGSPAGSRSAGSPTSADRDLFRLHIAERGPQVLRSEVSGIPGLDLVLDLHDAQGTRLAHADNRGPGEGEIIPNARLSGPGEYYLAVREAWVVEGPPADASQADGGLTTRSPTGESGRRTAVQYRLRAAYHALLDDEESEPDDTPRQAIVLAPRHPMLGYAGRLDDVDYYRLERGAASPPVLLSGELSGIPGVDLALRLEFVSAGGQQTRPPFQPWSRSRFTTIDDGGHGQGESFAGLPWPEGTPSAYVVVERHDRPRPAGRPGGGPMVGEQPPTATGFDSPYRLIIRIDANDGGVGHR